MSFQAKKGGSMPVDSMSRSIQNASNAIFQDATGTPNVSPFTTTDASVTTFVTPANCDMMLVTATVADVRYGTAAVLDGTADEGYDIILAGTSKPIPCSSGNITMMRDAAVDAVIYFRYEEL